MGLRCLEEKAAGAGEVRPPPAHPPTKWEPFQGIERVEGQGPWVGTGPTLGEIRFTLPSTRQGPGLPF